MAKRIKHYMTPSAQRAAAHAFTNGRGKNSAYTGGAQDAQGFTDKHGYNISQKEGMKQAWNENRNVATYTRTASGRMSVNGRTAGGRTWTFTDKENGRQSGRSKMASRRQRYYDVRVGLGLAGG